ncbi:DUF4260 family protein [Wenjunlia tyrosinilytica]|uniref:DUF4260 family protein n=1 Tax=Wenjunlia tyrosinilytica TaxID=1544741 RepID=A0A917ZQJ3_9ACTN|nr:DUF4260 family protein [Wenjunlia tyrosinilytica]GGO89018.1 hypothetical protein GCM10012280_31180 [Wenjunlia tyrosinilytica]
MERARRGTGTKAGGTGAAGTGPAGAWTWTSPLGRVLSGAVGVGALVAGARIGGRRSKVLWASAVAPDISLVIGIAAAPSWKRMPSYAIGPYNAMHTPVVPAAILMAAALTRNRSLLVAGLGWLGHIGWDRGWGYGPRDADGYIAARPRPADAGPEGPVHQVTGSASRRLSISPVRIRT